MATTSGHSFKMAVELYLLTVFFTVKKNVKKYGSTAKFKVEDLMGKYIKSFCCIVRLSILRYYLFKEYIKTVSVRGRPANTLRGQTTNLMYHVMITGYISCN